MKHNILKYATLLEWNDFGWDHCKLLKPRYEKDKTSNDGVFIADQHFGGNRASSSRGGY